MKFRSVIFRSSSLIKSGLRNYCCTAKPETRTSCKETSHLWKIYDDTKALCISKKLPADVDPYAVFGSNELNLADITVYGFDYDYTLACYSDDMYDVIYNLAKDVLVSHWKYPKEISNLKFIPNFATRGLHYDIERGVLLKVDSFHQAQLDSVHRGLTAIGEKEALDLYGGSTLIPLHYLESKMQQLVDLFSIPEICLLCTITEHFISNGIHYHPQILFDDVKKAVRSIHPTMHSIVKQEVSRYLIIQPTMPIFLERLKHSGKKLFLVTNSPYGLVNAGMSYLISPTWRELFDVVVCLAKKPSFFTDDRRPFRKYDSTHKTMSWDSVTQLKCGEVYMEGSVKQLQAVTGWQGKQVLYFGDHPYTDLADVTLHHGWRTGAVIKELEDEIKIMNKTEFKANVNWLQLLTNIIEDNTGKCHSNQELEVIQQWTAERDRLRKTLKVHFNPQFGSMFRTYHNPTYFSRRLFRFADIYTSSISNLCNYSLNHVFYPRRGALPHEYRYWFI